MGKTKISKKQKAFSLDDIKPATLKSGVKTKKHSPSEWLANPENIRDAIFECLQDDDYETLKEILKSHYDAMEYQEALRASNVPKRTYHHALGSKGNPTAKTLIHLIAGVLKTA